jgi:surface polysaccharide O-acyltransferase-like enzyme
MAASKTRHYDIDWLRVLGMGGIFLFHNARFFNDEDWHVKNSQLDFGMSVFVGIFNQFIMPLFFVLSAYAIYYALQHRSNSAFLRERVTRLLVPLIFGIFILVPPQVYIERVTHGDFNGSFIQFLPHYFDGWYGFGGNFAWMGLHLWYLLMLYLFSWLALPVFQRMIGPNAARLADLFTRPWAIYLLFIPISVMELLVNLSPDTVGRRDFGGWSPLTYFVVFLLGYMIATDERYRPAIARLRFVSLGLGLLATAVGYLFAAEMGMSTYAPAFSILRGFNTWCWLMAFMGLASQYLDFTNGFLKYANEAVLPFYILHQTVIVILGYFVRNWELAVFPKYLILAFFSFMIIVALYEGMVRRLAVTRYLFGMK